MARFRNTTTATLSSWEHGWTVGPSGELDWPGYDPDLHGATPGLQLISPPAAASRTRTRRPSRKPARPDKPAPGSEETQP